MSQSTALRIQAAQRGLEQRAAETGLTETSAPVPVTGSARPSVGAAGWTGSVIERRFHEILDTLILSAMLYCSTLDSVVVVLHKGRLIWASFPTTKY